MHHIASDAWSFGVFFEELKAFYNHFAHGDTLQLSDLPIQYGDYAAWQRATLTAALVGRDAGVVEGAALKLGRYVESQFPDGVRVERGLVSAEEVLR